MTRKPSGGAVYWLVLAIPALLLPNPQARAEEASCPGYDEAAHKIREAFLNASTLSPGQNAITELEKKAEEAERKKEQEQKEEEKACTKEEIQPLKAMVDDSRQVQEAPHLNGTREAKQNYTQQILSVAQKFEASESEGRKAVKAYLALKKPPNAKDGEHDITDEEAAAAKAALGKGNGGLAGGAKRIGKFKAGSLGEKKGGDSLLGGVASGISGAATRTATGALEKRGSPPGPKPASVSGAKTVPPAAKGLDKTVPAAPSQKAVAANTPKESAESAPQPSLRERAAGWLKQKGQELMKSAEKEDENGLGGFKKIGKEALGMASMVGGHVTEKAPEWGKDAAKFGKRLATGDLDAYKQAGIGTGKFAKDAVVGIYEGGKDAVHDWKSFGADHTTTYQGLKATAKTVGFLANFVVPAEGAAASVAAKAGLKEVVVAGGESALKQVAKAGVREAGVEALETAGKQALKQGAKTAVLDGAEGAGRQALKQTARRAGTEALEEGVLAGGKSSKSMMFAAVEKSEAAAAGSKQVAKDIAEHSASGAKLFEKEALHEVPPQKLIGEALHPPKPGAGTQSLDEIHAQRGELLEQMRVEPDPIKKKALQAESYKLFDQEKALELSRTPEFKRIQSLPVSAEEKKQLVQQLVETQVHPGVKDRVAGISEGLLKDIPETAVPARELGIAERAEKDILEARLKAGKLGGDPLLKDEKAIHAIYSETRNSETSLKHVNEEMWSTAAKGGEQGTEFIETGGSQAMPKQTRGTCPYHTACNIFQEDIQAGKLETKDILRTALEKNEKFAYRDPSGKLAGNGLKPEAVRDLFQETAEKVGKTTVSVPPEDMVKFMAENKQPLAVMINTGDGGHVMGIGKPFTMPVPDPVTGKTELKVVFQTFDGNNPTGVNGFIEADKLGKLMKGDAIAVVPKDSAAALKAAAPEVLSAVPESGEQMAALQSDRVLRSSRASPQVRQELEKLGAMKDDRALIQRIADSSRQMGELADQKAREAGRYPSGSPEWKRLREEATQLRQQSTELLQHTSAAGVPTAGETRYTTVVRDGAGVTEGAATKLTGSAPDEKLILPKSLGAAAAPVKLTSRIKDSSFAVRQAESLSEQAQRDVNSLLKQLAAGNDKPGIGTEALGDNFFQLRGRNGGRVIIKRIDPSTYEIVGKYQAHTRSDTANSEIIQRLIQDYSPKGTGE